MSLLFWPILILPGFALIRRHYPKQLESGLLGVVSISFLGTCAMLAPPLIVFYVLNAPLALFSGTIVVFLLIALLEITRRRGWPDLGRLFVAALSIELVILLIELILSARVGAFMLGDAQVHLARIRHILDHGLNNFDPFVTPTNYLFPIYHTNLFHALYAAASQLTGVSHLDVWHSSLPWGQVLVTSSCYYLAWTAFEDRWAAWLAAMFVIANRGPVQFVIYPNQLAPFWLWPLLLAFVIRAITLAPTRSEGRESKLAAPPTPSLLPAIPIAAASLVIGMTHSLYAGFAAMASLPVLAYAFVRSMLNRSSQHTTILICMLALAAGLPFAVATDLMTPHRPLADTPPALSTAPPRSGDFVHLENSKLIMRSLKSLPDILGGTKIGTVIFCVALLCAFFSPHRRRAMLLATFSLIAMLILFVPYLCTPLYRTLGEEWVLSRFEVIFSIVFFTLVPPAIGTFIMRQLQHRPFAPVARASLSLLTLTAGYFLNTNESPWTWKETFALAGSGPDDRLNNLNVYHDLEQFAKKNIPRGKVVLIHPVTGTMLTAVHDVRLVASASGSNGVPDLAKRLSDLMKLLAPETPWPQRRTLLREYRVDCFFLTPQTPADWTTGHLLKVRQSDHFSLLELRTQN